MQMAGYLKNKYVNIQYPWDGHEDPQAPNIPENNHVAIYRRRFALDAQLARTLENDGKCAALAEYWKGALQDDLRMA